MPSSLTIFPDLGREKDPVNLPMESLFEVFRREPTHFVFCREDGTPLDPDHMRNYVLYPAMDAAKIERQKRGSGLHMFRHTAGSVVYALTGDLKKAQDQLGHADIQTTGKFYVHTDDAQKEAAASAFEKAFAADLLPAFATQPN